MPSSKGSYGIGIIDIRDPLHGYILIDELERKIIDTRPVQRLHQIRQLAGAFLTYPGADHSRFGHSLGVMHIGGKMAEHLVKLGVATPEIHNQIRIAALLHDIGHGPFSHTSEPVLHRHRKTTHEDLTRWLILNTELGDILDENGFDKTRMAELSVGKPRQKKPQWLSQIISGHFDVDKMDFLLRDSYYTGLDFGRVDIYRLIYSTDILNNDLALDLTSLYALEGFIIARYEMFKACYFHKTVRAAEIMLSTAMNLAHQEIGLTTFETPRQYLDLDDGTILHKLRSFKDSKDPHLVQAYEIIKAFDKRQLLKMTGERVLHFQDKFTARLFTKEGVRKDLEADVAKKAGIDPEFVFIDVPTLPAIPYNPKLLDPMEIPVFKRDEKGLKTPQTLSSISALINVLKGYVDVIRCYTYKKYRKEVQKATVKVFEELPLSTQISY